MRMGLRVGRQVQDSMVSSLTLSTPHKHTCAYLGDAEVLMKEAK